MEHDNIHPMEIPPEHDPELARRELERHLEEFTWDAKEGHLSAGGTRTITEPGILMVEIDADDLDWTFRYEGDMEAAVIDPDGEERGTIELDPDDAYETMQNMGRIAAWYHEERQLSKAKDGGLEDVGDTVLLERNGKLELYDEEDRVLIYDAEHDPYDVVEWDDLTLERLEDAWESWREKHRAKMKEKYGEEEPF